MASQALLPSAHFSCSANLFSIAQRKVSMAHHGHSPKYAQCLKAAGCFSGWQWERRQRSTYMRVYSQLSVQQVISRCKNILMLPHSCVSSVTLIPPPTHFTDSLQTFMKIKMNICHFLGGTFAHASSLKHAKNPS